jgi:hypothetical protein
LVFIPNIYIFFDSFTLFGWLTLPERPGTLPSQTPEAQTGATRYHWNMKIENFVNGKTIHLSYDEKGE